MALYNLHSIELIGIQSSYCCPGYEALAAVFLAQHLRKICSTPEQCLKFLQAKIPMYPNSEQFRDLHRRWWNLLRNTKWDIMNGDYDVTFLNCK